MTGRFNSLPQEASFGSGQPVLSHRQLIYLILVWVAGTLSLLLFRPGYGFPPFEVVDCWIYTAYQWDLRNQIIDFGPTYYESRLSWILPGALLHSLLPPIAANLAFKLTVSAAFTAACTAIGFRAAGMPTAIAGVAVGLFAPQFIAGLHSDYSDTPVIVYASLTLACITWAKDSPRWIWWVAGAGVFFASMLVANLSAIGTPGLGIAVFHLLWLRWSFRRQLVCIGLYLLTLGIVVAGIGGLHVLLGGAFYFMKPQVDMMFYFHEHDTNPWSATNWLWVYGASWLVLPVSTLIWSARISLAQIKAADDHHRLIQALAGGLLVSFGWALFLECRSVSVLLYYYYASYHLCLVLPLLACLSLPASATARNYQLPAWLLAATLGAFVLIGRPLVGWSSLARLHPLLPTPESLPWLGAVVLLGIGAVLGSRFLPQSTRRYYRPEFMVLGLIICSMPAGFHGREISDRLRDRYTLIHTTYQKLADELPRGSYVFWIHPEERNGVALASTKLWGYRMLTDKGFPELGPEPFTEKTVVIPCTPGRAGESLDIATKTLATLGIEVVKARTIQVRDAGGLGFDLLCFAMNKLAIDPEHVPAGMKPPSLLMTFLAQGDQSYVRSLTRGDSAAPQKMEDAISDAPSYPVFTRLTGTDRLATDFHACASAESSRERELAIVATMPADGYCTVIIQDNQDRELCRATLIAGRTVFHARLPTDANMLRVLFESPRDPSTPLPSHILVYELHR